jgi:hypothetical protein
VKVAAQKVTASVTGCFDRHDERRLKKLDAALPALGVYSNKHARRGALAGGIERVGTKLAHSGSV